MIRGKYVHQCERVRIMSVFRIPLRGKMSDHPLKTLGACNEVGFEMPSRMIEALAGSTRPP